MDAAVDAALLTAPADQEALELSVRSQSEAAERAWLQTEGRQAAALITASNTAARNQTLAEAAASRNLVASQCAADANLAGVLDGLEATYRQSLRSVSDQLTVTARAIQATFETARQTADLTLRTLRAVKSPRR